MPAIHWTRPELVPERTLDGNLGDKGYKACGERVQFLIVRPHKSKIFDKLIISWVIRPLIRTSILCIAEVFEAVYNTMQ